METKKLELKKMTIAVLNETTMDQIVGGRTKHSCNDYCDTEEYTEPFFSCNTIP